MEDFIDPKLIALCNLKTIEEDSRGFFGSLIENIKINTRIREWVQEIWKNPIHGEDFIHALMKEKDIFKEVLETFTVTEVYRKKCEVTAGKMLAEAEELWKQQNWQRCRETCSQAILRAPIGSTLTTKLSHGNVLQGALLLRAHCLLKEGNIPLAKADLTKTLSLGTLQGTSKTYLREVLNELKTHSDDVEFNKLNKEKKPEIQLSAGVELNLPNASDQMIVSENLEQGRFLSCKKQINIGENLVKEQPYVACLKPQYFGTYCHHCFKKLEAPYGCSECAAVAFCSENCCKEANESYHKYECKFIDLFIGSGMSLLSHMALRMITQKGSKNTISSYNKYYPHFGKNEENLQSKNKQDFTSADQAVYKLVTHEESRLPQDYIHRTLMAFFLLRCLQKTSFFPKPTDISKERNLNELSSDDITVWSVLLFNLQVVQFNAHQVCSLRGEKELGCALYTTASLFNHDCCPSITRYFIGKEIVVKVLRPIEIGEAIGDSYGPQWGRTTKFDEGNRRRALYSRYMFKCRCRACRQDWLLPPSDFPSIRCKEKECNGSLEANESLTECNICHEIASLEYALDQQNSMEKCIEKIKIGIAIKDKEEKTLILEAALTEYRLLSHQPCPVSLKAEDALRSCYASQFDKFI